MKKKPDPQPPRELVVKLLENAQAVLTSDLAGMIVTAFSDGRIAEPSDVISWLLQSLEEPWLRVYLVRDRTPKWLGFAIVELPSGPFMHHPNISMLYAPADDVKAAILDELVRALFVDLGHSAVTGINRSDLSDEVYAKTFDKWARSERYGTMFTFHRLE